MNLFSETTQRAPGPDYFQRLAETLPGIIWIARADGSIEYINDEGNAFTGQTPEHTYEWGWMSLLHPDDAESARVEWDRAMREERPLHANWRIKRHDDAYRWMQVRARPLRDSNGEVDRWFGISTDITDEITLQDELREAEQLASESLVLLETLQSSTPVGFGYIDTDFRFVRVNWTMAEMTGLPLMEHPGRSVQAVAPGLWSQIEPVFRKVLESGVPARNIEISGEAPNRSADVQYWLLNCHPVTMREKVTGLGIVILDITERQRSEQFKTAVLKAMGDGVYSMDMDGKITYINESALAMTGYEPDEVIGKDAHDLFHFQHMDHTEFLLDDCELYRARISGEPCAGDDAPFTRKDNSMFVASYSIAPLKAGDSMYGAVIVFRDLDADVDAYVRPTNETSAATTDD